MIDKTIKIGIGVGSAVYVAYKTIETLKENKLDKDIDRIEDLLFKTYETYFFNEASFLLRRDIENMGDGYQKIIKERLKYYYNYKNYPKKNEKILRLNEEILTNSPYYKFINNSQKYIKNFFEIRLNEINEKEKEKFKNFSLVEGIIKLIKKSNFSEECSIIFLIKSFSNEKTLELEGHFLMLYQEILKNKNKESIEKATQTLGILLYIYVMQEMISPESIIYKEFGQEEIYKSIKYYERYNTKLEEFINYFERSQWDKKVEKFAWID